MILTNTREHKSIKKIGLGILLILIVSLIVVITQGLIFTTTNDDSIVLTYAEVNPLEFIFDLKTKF